MANPSAGMRSLSLFGAPLLPHDLLRLPLDLGDLSDQVAHFVAIEFSNFGDSVDILHEVF
jgi:hypothetical protein